MHNREVSRGGSVAVVVGISDRWQVLFFDKKSQKAKKMLKSAKSSYIARVGVSRMPFVFFTYLA